MKKFFCAVAVTAAILCGNACDVPISQNSPIVEAATGKHVTKTEKQILNLSFGRGTSVSSSGASCSISGGHAIISFNIPAGFHLRGDFDISGQIYAQISGGNGTFSETWSGSQSKTFNLSAGNCSISISDLKTASGKIILRLIPN